MKKISADKALSKSQVKNLYKKYVSRYKAEFFEKYGLDIVMSRREGIYFYDQNGKQYLNCHCNGGVFNLGHKNQRIISAVQKALQDYDIGNHHFISKPKAVLAQMLDDSINQELPHVKRIPYKSIFGVSGGEAADLAIKMARGYTRKTGVISIKGGYHGHTGLSMSAGDQKYYEPFNTHLPSFKQIQPGNSNALREAIDDDTACFILETIPATLGMPVFSQEYMQSIREICTQRNIVLILDEVQTGLGRTGKIWGFQNYDILPDIFITGKGLSGGIYPITATCYQERFESLFKKDPFIHISTFGGSEVGCFAALEVLHTITDKSFLEAVNIHAEYLKEEFNLLLRQYDFFTDFRQKGLFMGLVFKDRATCMTILKILTDNGIFAVYANNDPKVLQFLPPLIISNQEILHLMKAMKGAFAKMKSIRYKIVKGVISALL